MYKQERIVLESLSSRVKLCLEVDLWLGNILYIKCFFNGRYGVEAIRRGEIESRQYIDYVEELLGKLIINLL
ncbi:MAG: hypothetical protein QXY40_06305 [Candidatus Methanomethylicia archaeon]